MRSFGRLLTAAAVPGLCLFLIGRKTAPLVGSPSGLEFSPKTTSVEGSYPGKRAYEATLVSRRAYKNVRFSTSCACIVLVSPQGPFDLAAGAPVKVKFLCDSPDVRYVKQAVYLADAKTGEQKALMPVLGQLRSIFEADDGKPLELAGERRFSNEPLAKTVLLKPREGLAVDRCESEAGWIDTRLVRRAEGVEVRLDASPNVRDGVYTVPLRFDFHGRGGGGTAIRPFRLDVRSAVMIAPDQVWLGKVPRKGTVCRSLVFAARDGKPLRLRFTPGGPGVRIMGLKTSGASTSVTFSVGAPAAKGLFSSRILVWEAGRVVTTVRAAGLADS